MLLKKPLCHMPKMKGDPHILLTPAPPPPHEDCSNLNKQCRPWGKTTLCGISLGPSLFAKGPVYRIQNEWVNIVYMHKTDLQIRVCKNIFFLSHPKHMFWSHWDSSFEHQKRLFKLMGKKKLTLLYLEALLIKSLYWCHRFCFLKSLVH